MSGGRIGPIVIDCQMETICAQWNHDGSIIAIGGVVTADDKESNVIQFYDPRGQVRLIAIRTKFYQNGHYATRFREYFLIFFSKNLRTK